MSKAKNTEPTNQDQIRKALRDWEKLRGQQSRIEADRDRELQPLKETFDKAAKPICDRADRKLKPVTEKLATLESQIKELMQADATIRLVETTGAQAEVCTREEREIAPQKFFDTVREAGRGKEFWNCLKVLVTKADKLLGDRVAAICSTKIVHTVKVRLKTEAGHERHG